MSSDGSIDGRSHSSQAGGDGGVAWDGSFDAQVASTCDASLPTRQPTPPPANEGRLWPVRTEGSTLSVVDADLSQAELELPCSRTYQGARAAVVVTWRFRGCEELGPNQVALDGAGRLVVHGALFLADTPCSVRSTWPRELLTPVDLPAGTYPLVLEGTSSEDAPVLEVLPAACVSEYVAANEACYSDAQCPDGYACVYGGEEDADCRGHCQVECENHAGCQGGARGADCKATDDCADGLACTDAHCEWAVELSSTTRHACAAHDDCEQGLACVERAGGEAFCNLPCNAVDMRCPPGHYCSSGTWLCEWGGE